MSSAPKDRQRWQPEEDAILCAYATQYGPQDWHLLPERTGEKLDRDPKSCHERWKNYLKPGIKKGPLTEEEQLLVIKLQNKYGNKWKRIAAEVPGRTAKRLGKWWEVYKERKIKEKKKFLSNYHSDSMVTTAEEMQVPVLAPIFSRSFISSTPDLNGAPAFSTSTPDDAAGIGKLPGPSAAVHHNASGLSNAETLSEEEPVLTLGPSTAFQGTVKQSSSPLEGVATSGVTMPKWIPMELELQIVSTLNGEPCPSLSSSRTAEEGFDTASASSDSNESPMMSLFELFKQLREQREVWIQYKKRIRSNLQELKRQLEFERMEKQRRKIEEVESRVRALKDEKKRHLQKLEQDYEELVANLERDAELKENKIMEAWTLKYERLAHAYERYTISGP